MPASLASTQLAYPQTMPDDNVVSMGRDTVIPSESRFTQWDFGALQTTTTDDVQHMTAMFKDMPKDLNFEMGEVQLVFKRGTHRKRNKRQQSFPCLRSPKGHQHHPAQHHCAHCCPRSYLPEDSGLVGTVSRQGLVDTHTHTNTLGWLSRHAKLTVTIVITQAQACTAPSVT